MAYGSFQRSSTSFTSLMSLFVLCMLSLTLPHHSTISRTTAYAQTCYYSAVSMRFKPQSAGPPYSFLTHNNQSNVIMMRSRVFPRIIVQILDSNGKVDVSDATSDITIIATSTTRLGKDGVSVPVVYGEAVFTALLVEGVDPFYNLTFTATSSSPLLQVTGSQLQIFNVTNLQSSVNIFRLAFAHNNSQLMIPKQPLTAVLDAPVPLVTLNVLNSQYLTFPTSSTLGTNLSVVASFVSPTTAQDYYLVGNAVPVLDGVASFDGLTVRRSASSSAATAISTTVTLPALRFDLVDGVVATSLSVESGAVTLLLNNVEYFAMAFDTEEKSYIASQGQSGYGVGGTALPIISISLRGASMQRSPDLSGVIITATSAHPYSLNGAQVGVVNGIATFDSLTFDTRVNGRVVLTFTAGFQGALPLAGSTLQTGYITVTPAFVITPAVTMQFFPDAFDSFFTRRGQKGEVVLFQPISSIKLRILDSSNKIDTATPALVVTATASAGVQFASQTAAVKNGVVQFNNLQFTSSSDSVYARITFTAGGNSSVRVYGQQVITGIITVSAVQAKYNLRFQPYGAGLFSLSSLPSVATVNIPMPRIIVELTTSAGSFDGSSSTISITATAAGATLSGNYLRVTSGVASFDALTFVSEDPGTYIITFTAGMEGNAPVGGKQIFTGSIRVAYGVTAAFGIRFAKIGSYLAYEGHIVSVTQGDRADSTTPRNPLPPVVVELIDSAHNLSTSSSPIIIRAVPSTGTLMVFRDSSALEARIAPGQSQAIFTRLAITTAYSPMLTFQAIATANEPVNLQTVRSGAMNFYTSVQPFGMLAMTTPVARQALRVESGVAIYAEVRLLGTNGNAAAAIPSSTPVSISVSSSVPLRAPLTVQMSTLGVAVFSGIQFSQTVPGSLQPVLTFTASVQTSSTYRLDPICSGPISIAGPSEEAGVDLVAQLLIDYASFDDVAWFASLARRLGIESTRLLVTRSFYGTGADPNPLTATGTLNLTANAVAVWFGTRLDFRILEPRQTSRNTKSANTLAAQFLNLKLDCSSTPELYLRKTMNLSQDTTCDWYLFSDQLSGAQQCVLSRGTASAAYCSCHLPLIQTLGRKCYGYSTLTDLCLNTLLDGANCQDPTILSVCSVLQAAPVPRTTLMGSAVFFALLLAPLVYLKSSGFFAKLQRPEVHGAFAKMDKVNWDESDVL